MLFYIVCTISLTELVFICLDNFSTELVKKCENNSWKDNLDRQQREDKKSGLGTATKNKTLNQLGKAVGWVILLNIFRVGKQTNLRQGTAT